MSDIGGGRFFKDVALNVIMIYTSVFFFGGGGAGVSFSSTYTLNTEKG